MVDTPVPRPPGDGNAPGLTADELREELRLLDENIERAQRSAIESRRLIGERSMGATDREELSQLITEAEQQEAVLRILAARRERLQDRLASTS